MSEADNNACRVSMNAVLLVLKAINSIKPLQETNVTHDTTVAVVIFLETYLI